MKDIRSGSGVPGSAQLKVIRVYLRYIYNPSEHGSSFLSHLSPLTSHLSFTMSESWSPSPRPSVFPTPSRDPPTPPTSRPAATLLASRGSNHTTPIPPSFQAKMAAVCVIPLSTPSYLVTFFFQMAKRVPQSPDVDGATAALKRVSLGAPTSQLRKHSGRSSFVLSPGMAARRNKPLFKLSDITGEEPGGGAAGAGPAVGVPDETEWPPRRPEAVSSTPFANFGKIVYALVLISGSSPP
jgi:mitogen-activated protein kinase kinase